MIIQLLTHTSDNINIDAILIEIILSSLTMIQDSENYYPQKANLQYFQKYGYQVTKEIGFGGFGVVYKAIKHDQPQKQFAIKINFKTVSQATIYKELAFLDLAKGKPHLTNLCYIFIHDQSAHIVTEYFKFKPFSILAETLPIEQIKHYLWEVLSGLKELKELGIHHRDLKPGNFLYNPETRKGIIIDLGMAEVQYGFGIDLVQKVRKMDKSDPEYTRLTEKCKIYQRVNKQQFVVQRKWNKIGTAIYAPLESILRLSKQYYTSDIWAVGVMFLSFITRKQFVFVDVEQFKDEQDQNPYFANFLIQLATIFSQEKVINQCKKFKGEFQLKLPKGIEYTPIKQLVRLEGYDDEAHDLLMKLLDLDPETRITPQDALQHPFFDSVRYKDTQQL